MLRFVGNIDAKFDAKGRVFVPAIFRKVLQETSECELILRKDIFQNCLVLYPVSVWNSEVTLLRSKLSRWDKQQQQIFRQFVSDTELLELDANGRILIPKRYKDMIPLDSEVTFLGVDDRIEMWLKKDLESIFIPSDNFGLELEKLMDNDYE